MTHLKENGTSNSGRREFIKKSGIVLVGGSVVYPSGMLASSGTSVENTIKVGLIGCGGRGTGAASQALMADPNVVLTAMGDVFEDRLESSLMELMKISPLQIKVDTSSKFVGFDAYQKVIDSGVDVVLLATPPGFRPDHLTAAVDAGKHIFCEKPVAVDAPGVRKVLAAAEKAKEKQLNIVSGFCFRYDSAKRATFEKVLNGGVGDIKSVSTFRYGWEAWYKDRQPDWTDMTYKMRNWYYYNWLSGDFIVEQAVHSLDMMSWAMGDVMPIKAIGSGGRQRRTDEKYGNIYDHFAVEFEYENGAKGYHFTRQQSDTATKNSVDVFGSEGNALVKVGKQYELKGKENWNYEGEKNNMYQTQHDDLFAAIKNGTPINDGNFMAQSTLLAIWGREAGYTGQEITYDEIFNSQSSIGPSIDQYAWDFEWPTPPIAIPGQTKLV
ncbi:Gfo/Idh/MocA family protein [Maribacter halichondriae]|uniref:Gfo/Idh/MocA family protein n=1 Tax=Maribacter halichondriae TaxID=2980554 RepID=UPI0023581453|nr:Gfo/Idh/MocA family oxidoreductase [Maribacter sp. Hal144]